MTPLPDLWPGHSEILSSKRFSPSDIRLLQSSKLDPRHSQGLAPVNEFHNITTATRPVRIR